MSLDDTDFVVAWRNDPAISKWFFSEAEFTVEGHQNWLTRRLDSETDFNWTIEEDSRPIGTIAIYNIDWGTGIAEFGRIVIGESAAKGKGYAFESVRLVAEAARKVGLSKLFLEVKADNQRAIQLYLKSGFRKVSDHGGVVRMELLTSD
jgi:RimJ/RimL family protein N-acetyltransferase